MNGAAGNNYLMAKLLNDRPDINRKQQISGGLTLIPVDRSLQFRLSRSTAFPPFSLNPFAGFQILVSGEEVLDLADQILVDIVKFLDVIVAQIIGNAEYFIVTATVVGHREDANWARFHHNVWE
jgi:hypothetical protein